LPPLNRETLLRKMPDSTYRLVVDSFQTPQDAQKLSREMKSKGYEADISQHRISNKVVLHRVEIKGLGNREAANQAWDAAVSNRWIIASAEPNPKIVR